MRGRVPCILVRNLDVINCKEVMVGACQSECGAVECGYWSPVHGTMAPACMHAVMGGHHTTWW